jgi:hypothetical protein
MPKGEANISSHSGRERPLTHNSKRTNRISITIPVVRNTKQTLGPRSGPAAYARAVRRYDIVYVQNRFVVVVRSM